MTQKFKPKPLPEIPELPRQEERVLGRVLVTRDVAELILAYLHQLSEQDDGVVEISDERGQYPSLDDVIDHRGYDPPTLVLSLAQSSGERFVVEIDRSKTRIAREGRSLRQLYNEIWRTLVDQRTESRLTVLTSKLKWAIVAGFVLGWAALTWRMHGSIGIWEAIPRGLAGAFMGYLVLSLLWLMVDALIERVFPRRTGAWLVLPREAGDQRIRASESFKQQLIGGAIGLSIGIVGTLVTMWLRGD